MMLSNKTWEEAVKDWRAGKTVWSASLGGLGPGYEQAIQVLLWEILARWTGAPPASEDNKYPEAYNKHVEQVIADLDRFGFSGAQVGAAKATAYQFMAYGYEHMMDKLPDDRWIQVSRNFPSLPELH